jgi:hypothetical protein
MLVLQEMDRKETHWNGRHWRTMRSDYPTVGGMVVNASTFFSEN